MNIANEPTYFIALKDDAGLVKKYADESTFRNTSGLPWAIR